MDGVKELIQKWWNEFEVQVCPDFQLGSKLKMLKSKSKEWSGTTFRELQNKKNNLLNELAELDLTQENKELNVDERMIGRQRLWSNQRICAK